MTEGIHGRILVNNNQLIAVNKLPGESVQPDKTEGSSLLDKVANYCKHPVHVLTRLDKPCSGVVLFAKKGEKVKALADQMHDGRMQKRYLAAVENIPEQTGRLERYLHHNKRVNKSYVSDVAKTDYQKCAMTIEVLASSDRYHLVMAEIETGRHHQIRAILASLGACIKGDVKYGAKRKNKDRSIHLHAWMLTLEHPIDNQPISVEAPLPDDPVWNAFSAKISETVEGFSNSN